MQQSNKLEMGRITILCCRRVLFHLQLNVPLTVINLDVRSQGVQNKRVLLMYIATETDKLNQAHCHKIQMSCFFGCPDLYITFDNAMDIGQLDTPT